MSIDEEELGGFDVDTRFWAEWYRVADRGRACRPHSERSFRYWRGEVHTLDGEGDNVRLDPSCHAGTVLFPNEDDQSKEEVDQSNEDVCEELPWYMRLADEVAGQVSPHSEDEVVDFW